MLLILTVAVVRGRNEFAHDLQRGRARAAGLGDVAFEVTALGATSATLENLRLDPKGFALAIEVTRIDADESRS